MTTLKELSADERLFISRAISLHCTALERPHPTDVGWGFYGLAPVKPR